MHLIASVSLTTRFRRRDASFVLVPRRRPPKAPETAPTPPETADPAAPATAAPVSATHPTALPTESTHELDDDDVEVEVEPDDDDDEHTGFVPVGIGTPY